MSVTVPELRNDKPWSAPDRASWIGEGARYLAASCAALALDAMLLWIGVSGLSLAPWFAGLLSYGAGLCLIYRLSTRWVFAERAIGDRSREFFIFAILGVIGLILNSLTLHIATGSGVALPIAKALSAGIGLLANFVSRKVLLFRARRP